VRFTDQMQTYELFRRVTFTGLYRQFSRFTLKPNRPTITSKKYAHKLVNAEVLTEKREFIWKFLLTYLPLV